MKLLIDTNVFIWMYERPDKIGTHSLSLLEDHNNTVYLSHFSIFEIKIKSELGKLNYDPAQITEAEAMGIELLTPTIEQISSYKIWSATNKDPFDNMLMSVVKTERCAFITSDEKILATKNPTLKIIDARS